MTIHYFQLYISSILGCRPETQKNLPYRRLDRRCGSDLGRELWDVHRQDGVIAFAANQRDEVRDLHDVAGALNAQPGIKQQTFVAGFSAGAGASAGSIGYHESVAPTLKAGASGNCMPSVLCINDQGGQVMEISENMTGHTAGAGARPSAVGV